MKRIAFVLALLLLAGCGESAEEGIIISKTHRDAYTSYYPVCTAYYPSQNVNGVRTGGGCMIWTQVPDHHPEQWRITIQDCRKAVEEGEQPESAIIASQPLEHCLRGDIRVGNNWDGLEIGDWYGEDPPLMGRG